MKITSKIAIFPKSAFRLVQEPHGLVTTQRDGTLSLKDSFYVEERANGRWTEAELTKQGWVVHYDNELDAGAAFARLCSAQKKIQAKDAR